MGPCVSKICTNTKKKRKKKREVKRNKIKTTTHLCPYSLFQFKNTLNPLRLEAWHEIRLKTAPTHSIYKLGGINRQKNSTIPSL